MKGALLLTVILAGLIAVQGNWERNKVYKYEVKTNTSKYSSQPKDETTGLYYRLNLTLRPYSDDVIVGKITHAEFANGKPHRYDDEDHDYSDSSDDGNFENSPLSKPFKINLRYGVIQSLGVDNSLSAIEVNELKLIMSQFQVDTSGQNVNSLSENHLPRLGSNTAFYRKMEPTGTGHCETIYDISPIADYLIKSHRDWVPLPQMKENNEEFFQIVKTRDSANCVGRRNDLAAAAPSNYLYDHLNAESVSENDLSIVESQRIVVSGSMQRFTIQSALTANKLMYGRNTSLIAVYMNSTLQSVELASPRYTQTQVLPDNLKIVENLIYEFNNKMEDNKYQSPQQPRSLYPRDDPEYRVYPREEPEYRYTTACWAWFMNRTDACRQEFGRSWRYAGKYINCNLLGLTRRFQCKLGCK